LVDDSSIDPFNEFLDSEDDFLNLPCKSPAPSVIDAKAKAAGVNDYGYYIIYLKS